MEAVEAKILVYLPSYCTEEFTKAPFFAEVAVIAVKVELPVKH